MSEKTPSSGASGRVGLEIDPTLPEPVRRFLAAGARLERIVLSAEGQWSHEGEPFENERLKSLFHRSISRTAGGTWVLHIPPYTYPIEVEDAPYQVRGVRFVQDAGGERALLHLSDESEEPLAVATLRSVPGRGFYCLVKGGTFEARFSRPAYYQLAERVAEEGGRYWLRLGGERTEVPVTERPAQGAPARVS